MEDRRARTIAEAITETLKDILAPRVCCGCFEEGSWCCSTCISDLTWHPNDTCLGCHRFVPGAVTCGVCRPKIPLHRITAVADYRNVTIRQLIHTVKYARAHDANSAVGEVVTMWAATPHRSIAFSSGRSIKMIIPIPLHRRGMRSRGFNQSIPIAEALAACGVGDLAIDALQRVGRGRPQAQLPHEQRFSNIAGRFRVRKSAVVKISGAHIVLVDDVITTGATASTCARILRDAGARTVSAFALARGT
jgi:ComF family protein